MGVATIFAYLAGRRQAILEIAADRSALGVGALLVLSAWLARNYDRASLIHEPWRLLGPFVASLAVSGPLFLSVYGLARWKGMESPGIGRAYRAFLALYWMTAPLAWLYGIPYERFLSATAATDANLGTLALVSVWRVALMIRVVSVVFDLRVRTALPLVMLVADGAALTALHLAPLPVIHVMGGISPEQSEIAWTALLVTGLGWVTLPLWIYLVAIVAWSRSYDQWRARWIPVSSATGHSALIFAGLCVAAWVATLPFTQPKQILARRVEQTYRIAGPRAALALMSAHERGDFPPGWQPPPRRFPGDPPTSEVLDTLEALAVQPHASWVGELYSRRFCDRVSYDPYGWPNELLLREHAPRLAGILARLPQGPTMAQALAPWLSVDRAMAGPALDRAEDQRAALETLWRLATEANDEPPHNPIPASSHERGTH
jgi:hypothetical protein